MIFERIVSVDGEDFPIRVNSEDLIDPNIHKLSELCLVEFDLEIYYPQTIIHSNIAGIDDNLGIFVLGNRFGIYNGHIHQSIGTIEQNIIKYMEDMGFAGGFKTTKTTYSEIEKDRTWLDKFLTA